MAIGSRDAGRAEEAAGRVRERVPEAQVEGLENPDAAQRGPIVFLAVPFRAQSENLTNLKEALSPGQILVDATVPLAAAVSGKATRLLGVPQGSAARAGAGDGARRRDGGQRAAHGERRRRWATSTHELDEDVLVTRRRRKDDKRRVAELIALIPACAR